MSDSVWSAQDTTPEAIDSALRDLLYRRHAEDPSLAPARVLNLVVVADRSWKGEVANRLERVGRYHASRTILCAVEPGRRKLDATAVMAYDEQPDHAFGVMREQVEIDLGEMHLAHLEAVIDPVIEEELPLMLWCPHGHDEAVESLREMTDVILLDSDQAGDPASALARADELLESAYVVDLAWLRTTPWRERLASSFDLPRRMSRLGRIDELAVRHRDDSLASAGLLAGWLASRLGWELGEVRAPDREQRNGAAPDNGAALRARARRDGGELTVSFRPTEQDAPGLAGVTICSGDDFSLSLDRGQGGLCAHERMEGEERDWRVLGASRGEGGILGEGVRQALLRDPTYGPALRTARRLWR